MKKISTLIAVLLALSAALPAQTPVNDDCAGLIDLGFAPVCPPDTFTNFGATPSDIGSDNNPSCFNSNVAHRDVWFMFTCPDTAFDFRITLTGVGANSILNPEFAVYRGDCSFDGLAELLCAKADLGENVLFLDVTGLTPGLPYFIRVSDYSVTAAPNWGEFTLCVDNIPPVSNVDDGGSTLCEGTLYDTGGPDDDYGPDEDHVFVICPAQPSACITFTLDYYNIDNGFGDALTFYDGDDTNAPVLAAINGAGFGPPNVSGGGAVCFMVTATSGCLTIQMQSDFAVEQEGFAGHWECSNDPCMTPLTPLINTSITNDSIINAVSTPATTVTVTNINCADGAYGTFNHATDDSELGLKKGLILTSGDATLVVGPNFLTASGLNNGFEGDNDLDYLSQQQGGSISFDACIVELDVFAATDELSFEYVFGSEEYPEFVGSGFNDIFAFFVSGPGIVGDPNLTNSAKNIAVIPGTNDAVTINSVNNNINWQFYRNNEIGQSLEYDGLTSDQLGVKKSLTAHTEVIPCNTYHLKLAVADRADGIYDSGVFISEIQGGTPNLGVQFASGIDYFIEDCSGNQDQLIISLSELPEEVTSFTVTVGGTATLGVDYVLNIPAIITFQPGQSVISFPIFPIADALVEGTETIVISLSNNFGCGTVVYKTIVVNLEDNVHVEVNAGADTLFVCAGATLQLLAEGAQNYFWSPPGVVSNAFIANPTITPTQDVMLTVLGTVGAIPSCLDLDTVFIKIIDPAIDVSAQAATNICQGTGVPLLAANNVGNSGLVWTPSAGLDNPNSPTPVATPSATTTYTATVSIAGCSVSDQVTINVDTLFFPTLSVPDGDTTVCQNYPVQLANILNTSTDYLWTPADGLDDPTSSGPIALPEQSTVYTLTATSANNYCTQTAEITVDVIAADIDVLGDDYREICLGDTVALNAVISPLGQNVVWTPPFYVSSPTGDSVLAFPDESVTIIATVSFPAGNGFCVVRDSVRLRVDSLPDGSLSRLPNKAIYCIGDTVILFSPTYEPASFPNIDFNWIPFGGEITPDSFWNMVIVAQETHTFLRVASNRGCSRTDSVEVPVSPPPTLTVTADPTAVCAGEMVQINVTVDPPGTTLEWMSSDPTLSCTDCPNPTAMPQVTTTYNVSTPDAPCPSGASVTIVVSPAPLLALTNDTTICLGEDVVLNNITDPLATYSWNPSASLDDPDSAQPLATPTETTTYTVTAELQDCTVEQDVTVTVADATVSAGADQKVCAGTEVTLTAEATGTTGGTFVWQPDAPAGNPIVVEPGDTTLYTVTYFYGNGIPGDCQTSDDVLVAVVPNLDFLEISAEPDTSTLCQGVPIALSLSGAPDGADIVWTVNDEPQDTLSAPEIVVTPGGEGTYVYGVTATDANGCTGTAEPVSFVVVECIQFPNAFSPDGDGTNETFSGLVLTGGEVEIIEFIIFNRWGQKVFEATENEPAWDGTVDGNDAPVDVYVFYLRYRLPGGTAAEEPVKGEVMLLR